MTTCADLLDLRSFRHIKLVAGKNGLHRRVSWPYTCVTPTVSQWLHGGELLFVVASGFQFSADYLPLLLQECVKQELAGIVILMPKDTEIEISPDVHLAADKSAIPVFVMPWELKLVDVMREISELIVSRREESSRTQHFLEQVLFNNVHNQNFGQQCSYAGVSCRNALYVVVVQIDSNAMLKNMGTSLDIRNRLNHQLMNVGYGTDDFQSMRMMGKLIGVGQADSIENAIRQRVAVSDACSTVQSTLFPDSRSSLRVGFSSIGSPKTPLTILYNESLIALDTAAKLGLSKSPACFEDLGLLALLKETPLEYLHSFYNAVLGRITSLDSQENSSLYSTLRVFLQNNGNYTKTAKELYIHRNTLMYRISQIEAATGKNLENPMVRAEMLSCILIRELLL